MSIVTYYTTTDTRLEHLIGLLNYKSANLYSRMSMICMFFFIFTYTNINLNCLSTYYKPELLFLFDSAIKYKFEYNVNFKINSIVYFFLRLKTGILFNGSITMYLVTAFFMKRNNILSINKISRLSISITLCFFKRFFL